MERSAIAYSECRGNSRTDGGIPKGDRYSIEDNGVRFRFVVIFLLSLLAHASDLVAATLSGTEESFPNAVNLTQEGASDWVHWGRDSATSVNRKAGVTAQISNYTLLGTTVPSRFINARAAYAWSDGTPTVTESGTTTGLFFRGVGNGYEVSLPADTTSRTARLYVGGWKARGELTVFLSDNSAPVYGLTIDNPNGIIDKVVRLDYSAASSGQKLVVRYQLADDYGLSGNITLQAITLQSTNSLSLPLTYDFQDGTANGWSAPVDDSGNPSAWVVEGGVMRQDAYVEGRSTGHPYVESYHLGTYRYLEGLTASDYRFSVDIMPLPNLNADDVDGNDVGVMFRYQDPNNYYRLSFNARYGFARLEKRVGGQFTTLAVDARGYTDSQIFRVTVIVAGSRMQLFVDQGANGRSVESRFAVRDTSLSTGTVALYAQDSAAFDNVSLKAILAGPPAIVLSTPTSQSIVPDGNVFASAVSIPMNINSTVNFYLNGVLCNPSPLTSSNGFYSTNCGLPKSGDNTVEAVMTRNGTNYTDTHVGIATGDYIVGVGDSITNGIGDRFSGDNGTSANGRIVASQGYEGVLSDLLAASIYPSQIVFNEGVGGDTTLDCIGRIDSVIARHGNGNNALLLLGTNDSGGSLPVPSGLGCTGDACSGTYKGQMQQIIDAMIGAGLSVRVARVPPAWGTANQPYAYPLSASRNQLIRDYNQVIANELTGIQQGPDLFSLFYDDNGTPSVMSDDDGRSSLFDDNLHPNGLGHAMMARAWFNAITGSATTSFFLHNLCNRLKSSTCAGPIRTQHKQNLLGIGNRYFIDRDYTLTAIPPAVRNGVWVMTADAEAASTASRYVEFTLDRPATLYVAYDAGATALPTWLDPALTVFVDTGYQIETTDPNTPVLKVYSRDQAAGTVSLGGNMATGAAGADSNYLAIVVEQ